MAVQAYALTDVGRYRSMNQDYIYSSTAPVGSLDNLFLVATEKDNCSYETIRRFDQLPYEHKVIFTHTEYPEFASACYIKGFEEKEELGVLTFYKNQLLKRRYLDDFDYVTFLNKTEKTKSGGQ